MTNAAGTERGGGGGGAACPEWVAIDHVQLAIPPGGEDEARRFYGGVLAMAEIPKPAPMAVRGGAWFAAGPVQVHVGAEEGFVPARKAHPALAVRDLRAFVEASGLDATWNDELGGVVRCHVFDPFGNRIELVDADTAPNAPGRGAAT
ncbi:glyoxalase [Ilumatobacter sp.]|uniref:glyoxalase n=1 Tax=Ilumatobacter sp. TaxID=1967498 RepID=UPI003B522E49